MRQPFSLNSVPKAERRMWFRTAGLFAVGLGAIYVSHHSAVVFPEILRDVGIALVIATVVTVAYEAYARERLATDTLNDLLEKVVGDIVDSEVWREMREQILEKTAMRRQATLRLKLSRREGVPGNQLVVWVSLEYRLASLRSYAHKVRVLHFLDAYMENTTLALPRFLQIMVGSKATTPDANVRVFDQEVSVGGRGEREVPMAVEREELVYLPGNYIFIMSELTQLESVFLLGCPDDVAVHLNWTFGEADVVTTDAVRPLRFFLPGQCLEFRFTRRPT